LSKKRTSRVSVRLFRDVEEEQNTLVKDAMEASLRGAVNGGASTSAGSANRKVTRRTALAAGATENSLMGGAPSVEFDVVSDSDPEGELMETIDSEDEPIVQRDKPNLGKGRGKDKGPECDTDDIPRDHVFARKEARRLSRVEKQEIRMLEIKLGRRLTHVCLAAISLPTHPPLL
jgi:hypothetical protein